MPTPEDTPLAAPPAKHRNTCSVSTADTARQANRCPLLTTGRYIGRVADPRSPRMTIALHEGEGTTCECVFHAFQFGTLLPEREWVGQLRAAIRGQLRRKRPDVYLEWRGWEREGDAVLACGTRLQTWTDGDRHAVVEVDPPALHMARLEGDCLIYDDDTYWCHRWHPEDGGEVGDIDTEHRAQLAASRRWATRGSRSRPPAPH